jgi:predicted methyltransferase
MARGGEQEAHHLTIVTSGLWSGLAASGTVRAMHPLRSLSLLACLASTAACGSVSVPPGPSTTPPTALSPETDAALRAATAGPARTDAERARDVHRHPAATLAFFGLRDDMNVVELWPGGGYYTAILAPLLAGRGKLAVTHFDPAGDPKSEDTEEAQAILARLSRTPDVFSKVEHRQIAIAALSFGTDASADMVVTFRNVHNWIEEGYADRVFAAAFRVLKPGGILGVEEHRGKPGMTVQQVKDTGYVPEDMVASLAEGAGFRLAGRSEVNANPRDTTDHPKGVWSLPPVLAGKDVDREKFLAIGESDRMTLRFVKP